MIKISAFFNFFLEFGQIITIFAATITVYPLDCDGHWLHICRAGNVESLHF